MDAPETFIVLFIGIAISAATAMLLFGRRWQREERERLLGPLRSLFDMGSAEFNDPKFFSMQVNRRILRGRRGGRDFEIAITGPHDKRGKHGPRYGYRMELRLSSPPALAFRAGWANGFTDFGARIGLLQDVQIGQPELDELLRFRAPDAEALVNVGRRESFRAAIRGLAASPCFHAVEAGPDGLVLHRRHDYAEPLSVPGQVADAVARLESLRAALLG